MYCIEPELREESLVTMITPGGYRRGITNSQCVRVTIAMELERMSCCEAGQAKH